MNKKKEKNEYEKTKKKITVRYSFDDYSVIEKNAKQFNLTIVEYIRNTSLNKKINPIKSKIDNAFVKELRLIGNNLNQLTRKVNSLFNRNKDKESLKFKSDVEKIKEAIISLKEKYDS